MAQRVLISNPRVPSNRLRLFERGAIVPSSQVSVNTVTVFADHGIATGDKFLYAPSRTNVWRGRVFTVTGVAADTITFSGAAFTFIAGSHLLNLGADTGGVELPGGVYSELNYDGSTVYPYTDPLASSRYTGDVVPLDPGIGWTFWTDDSLYWAVALDSGNWPVMIWPDVGGVPGAGGGGGAAATRGTTFPVTPDAGDFHTLVQGAGLPDITYQYIKLSDDTFAWVEIFRAS